MKSILAAFQVVVSSRSVEILFNYLSHIKTSYLPILLIMSLFFSSCSKLQMKDIQNQKSDSQASGIVDQSGPDLIPPEGGGPLLPTPEICNGTSCDLDPLTTKPAVTLILLALGDEANQQLVINGASSQLIAETVVRYTSPVANPKILVVQDSNIHGEDPEDTQHLLEVLLKRYNVTYLKEPEAGLSEEDLSGFDLVWFNNPGHSMTSSVTFETFKKFKGGLVLQGDDLSRGNGFSMESLTRVKYMNNGTSVACGEQTYNIDNNAGSQYVVSMNSQYFPEGLNSALSFNYGNDIDLVEVLSSSVEVLASARVDHEGCTSERPAILRYFIE